ncbi:MAG: HDOD domain-containing protein [Opitutales bacterium]|nr:HDOD domain-containing protein [Opitutales bacterium]
MANILLLDDSDVAQRAMQGILARTDHRMVCCSSVDDAWEFILQNVVIDLIFLELKIKETQGWVLLQRLREHGLLSRIPVVVYTKVADRNVVRRMLAMKIQNYLVKPYSDDKIFAEIAKAESIAWRKAHLEDADSFCAQMNLKPEVLKQKRDRLRPMIRELIKPLQDALHLCSFEEISERMEKLKVRVEECGYWGLFDQIELMLDAIERADWPQVDNCIKALEFSDKLLYCLINPEHLPEGLITEEEANAEQIRREKEKWLNEDAIRSCPIVNAKEIADKVNKLPGYPMIDSVAAKLLMALEGSSVRLSSLFDLTQKDPGFAAQILKEAAKIDREREDPIEDPKIAVQLLGESRLKGIAHNIKTIKEHDFEADQMNWPKYWMHQMAVARMSAYMCELMELHGFMPTAYWGGLMHELGKLLIAQLYPFGFQAVVRYSQSQKCSMAFSEKKFLDCTSNEIGAYSAQVFGLPRVYGNIMRWINNPQKATEDQDMVALVSMARDLCVRFKLGNNGDICLDPSLPLDQFPAWEVLRLRVFPSFDLRNFERKLQIWSRELREELTGKLALAVS